MRTFEVLLWLANSTWAAWWVVGRPSRRIGVGFTTVSLLITAVHLLTEGARFHMLPTYLLMAGVLAVTARRTPSRGEQLRSGRWARVASGIAVAGWITVAGVLPLLFPVFTYEMPAGPYRIGTAEYELKNAGNRDLVIQAWYAIARDAKGRPAAITSRPELLAAAYASFTGLPKPLFDHLRLVKTHAIPNAPVARARARFPVVLFSHGPLSANRSQSVFQMEALATRGFIVIAIDHTGYASTTIFPDGHAVAPDPNAAWPVFVDTKSTAMLQTWAADVGFVIDRLEVLNEPGAIGVLTGRMDLSRIGYVGASFGGSVVVQTLLDEPRIKAGVAQDGKPYFSDQTLTKLDRPLMYMQSAAPYITSTDAQLAKWGLTAAQFKVAEQDHYARQMRLFSSANGPIYNVFIRRTNHVTFSDLYLIIGFPDSKLMDIRRAHRIINDYTVAFFERYLNGEASLLVDGHTPGPYQEVTVASRNVPKADQLAENGR
jgi:predicted dienelactone hydrolase